MTPRIQNRANQPTPVGSAAYALVGCIGAIVLPVYGATRWVVRKIIERTRS